MMSLPEFMGGVAEILTSFVTKEYFILISKVFNGTPPKTNMASWKITIFNGSYIFKWLFFHCHVSSPGTILIQDWSNW